MRLVALLTLLEGGVNGEVGVEKCMLEYSAENREEAHSKDSDVDGSIMIIIIFINCNWVVTRWQWLFNTHTKHEIGFLLNLRREGYMRSK
jgi:hypothetical protein